MGKTYYILYQVTNNLNGKIYVGVHKTKKLDDGYMGSGKVITSAIAKYGIENFTRVILEQFENSAAMYAREKEVVTDEFLLREDTYNLRRGGFGGFDHINKERLNNSADNSTKACQAAALKINTDPEHRDRLSKIRSTLINDRFAAGYISEFTKAEYRQKGCEAARSDKAKAKRNNTFAKIAHQQGEKNSQFGKMWITNEIESKKILKTDLVPEGWRVGRIIRIKS